jgi:hypothetical protein
LLASSALIRTNSLQIAKFDLKNRWQQNDTRVSFAAYNRVRIYCTGTEPGRYLGGFMFDFLGNFFGGIAGLNWEAIVQLTMLGGIAIAGPIVIFLLAARGGDL